MGREWWICKRGKGCGVEGVGGEAFASDEWV